MLPIRHLCILLVSLSLVSCVTGTPKVPEAVESAHTVKAPLDGIWQGVFDINGRGRYDFTALHIQGRSTAVSVRAKAMCRGRVELQEGQYYMARYELFALDGAPFDQATITGTLDKQAIRSHFVTMNGGDIGAINLDYNPIYERKPELAELDGHWFFIDRDGLETNMRIRDGQITGADSDGCGYQGTLAIIDSRYNLLDVVLNVSSCDSVNGEYIGLAYFEPGKKPLVHIDALNNLYGFHYALQRVVNSEVTASR